MSQNRQRLSHSFKLFEGSERFFKLKFILHASPPNIAQPFSLPCSACLSFTVCLLLVCPRSGLAILNVYSTSVTRYTDICAYVYTKDTRRLTPEPLWPGRTPSSVAEMLHNFEGTPHPAVRLTSSAAPKVHQGGFARGTVQPD